MFLYYIPGSPRTTFEKLSYAFEGTPQQAGCTGPDNAQGYIYANGQDARIGYYPDHQTWQEFPYLGCWIGKPLGKVTPDRLARKQMLRGRELAIEGQHWHIPIARSFEWDGTVEGQAQAVSYLSRYFHADPQSGEWQCGDVQADYQQLWDDAFRWWNIYYHANYAQTDDDAPPLDPPMGQFEQLDLACRVLSVNYRVGPAEIGLLNLLSGDTAHQILDIVIDVEALLQIAKKKAALIATSSIDAGQQADTPTTPQPLPIG